MSLEEQADIYILPSKMKQMSQIVNGSLVINPKRASFDSGPGSYGIIEIEQLPKGHKVDVKSNVKASVYSLA